MLPITMTIAQLVAARAAGVELAELDLPMQLAFDVRELLRDITARLETFETQRRALFDRFGDERDTTELERRATGDLRVREIRPADQQAYAEQITALLAVTVTFDRGPIGLPIGNGVQIKPRTLVGLGPFVQRDTAGGV